MTRRYLSDEEGSGRWHRFPTGARRLVAAEGPDEPAEVLRPLGVRAA